MVINLIPICHSDKLGSFSLCSYLDGSTPVPLTCS